MAIVKPMLLGEEASRDYITGFFGYNHNLQIKEGEWYDMENCSSDFFPALSPRKKRAKFLTPNAQYTNGYFDSNGIWQEETGTTDEIDHCNGIISKDALCYVNGKYFCINNYKIDLGLTDGEKTLVSMGAYVIILPDKKYINTINYSDKGNIEAEWITNDGVDLTLCDSEGNDLTGVNASADEPSNPSNGAWWIDLTNKIVKRFAKSQGVWNTVSTIYVKISQKGIGKNFNIGDGVKIDGFPKNDNSYNDFNGTSVIQAKDDDYIVIIGLIYSNTLSVGSESQISVKRTMPDMDFVIESGNRLWGCKYGLVGSSVVNEIYCSKQGDFKNWNCFQGISTDSYVASCGTDGKWTGAITHLGYPIFFKENVMHKVYGSYPAQYQIQTTECRGVQDGCSQSLAIVNEMLLYKSRTGVMYYDGSLPTEISDIFGLERYSQAVAGAINNKYFISMKNDVTGEWNLFCFDYTKGLWFKEDNTRIRYMSPCRGNLYFLKYGDGHIYTLLSKDEGKNGIGEYAQLVDYEDKIKWCAESGIIGTNSPDKKYISRIDVRMMISRGASVKLYIQYDSSGDFYHLFTMTGSNLKTFSVPVNIKRCDHFRLRFEGEGEAKIFSISKTMTQGSDY